MEGFRVFDGVFDPRTGRSRSSRPLSIFGLGLDSHS